MIRRIPSVFLIILAITAAAVSAYVSLALETTDFPCYYRVAQVIAAEDSSLRDVYSTGSLSGIKEAPPKTHVFVYAPITAYLFYPLSLLPYYVGKAVFVFVSLAAYLVAVFLPLRALQASGRLMFYPLIFSLIWVPFLQSVRFVQVEAVLLLAFSLGVWLVSRRHDFWGGGMMGVAALLKLYPLLLAGAFGLKSYRVLVGGLALFCLGLAGGPALGAWFDAVQSSNQKASVLLQLFGPAWHVGFSLVIVAVTGYVVLRLNLYPELLAAYIIPAVLLVLPTMGTRHLTMLVYSFVVVWGSKEIPPAWKPMLLILLFFLACYSGFFLEPPAASYAALFLFWFFFGKLLLACWSHQNHPA